MSTPGAADDLEVAHWLSAVRRRRELFLGVVGLAVLVAAVVGLVHGPRYEATAEVLIGAPRGLSLTADATSGGANLAAEVKAARGEEVRRAALSQLGSIPDVDVEPDEASNSLSFRAVSSTPEGAARAANGYAAAFQQVRRNREAQQYAAVIGRLRAGITRVQGELAAPGMTGADAAAARTQLLAQLEAYQRALQQVQVDAAVETSGDQILSSATAQPDAQPLVLLYIGYALAGGLLLAVGLVGVAEFLDRSVHDARGVRAALGLPVLGRLSGHGGYGDTRFQTGRLLPTRRRVPPEGDVRPVLWEDPKSTRADAVWALRAQVLSLTEGGLHVLLVAGCRRDDGAGEVAANLAVALARSGGGTILACLEGTRPLHLPMRDEAETDGTEAGASPSPLLRPVIGLAALRVAVGTEPGTSASADTHTSSSSLVEKLQGLDEYVVVFGPPVLSSAGTLEAARHVDGVILAVRAGVTATPTMVEAREMLGVISAPVIGVVLT